MPLDASEWEHLIDPYLIRLRTVLYLVLTVLYLASTVLYLEMCVLYLALTVLQVQEFAIVPLDASEWEHLIDPYLMRLLGAMGCYGPNPFQVPTLHPTPSTLHVGSICGFTDSHGPGVSRLL